MKKHILTIHENKSLPKPFQCEVCLKSFSTQFWIEKHSLIHSENRKKNHKCDSCGKAYFTPYDLDLHAKSVHEEKRVTCQYCGLKLTRRYTLKNHILAVHSNVAKFKCSICDREFKTNAQLLAHIRTCHKEIENTESPNMSTCDKCNKTMKTSYLKNHIKQVHGKKHFECDICGYAGALKTQLVSHYKHIHTKRMKDINCTLCDKSFYAKNDLKAHVSQVHEKRREFQCALCNTKFCRSYVLKQHVISKHEKKNDP